MKKCECYHIYSYEPYHGVCFGTKELEYCSCGGDTSRCDFYPEKREEVSAPCQYDELMQKYAAVCKERDELKLILKTIEKVITAVR